MSLRVRNSLGMGPLKGQSRAGISGRRNRHASTMDCAAKQKDGSTQAVKDAGTNVAAPPVSPSNVDLAREEYDRAVSDYQNCLLDNTANLSACERQRAAMNGAATVLFGRSNKGNTIVNDGR
jgi:hypothetical protein